MFLIDESYFFAEISIPTLPVKTLGEEDATWGVALAIQTSGESNLYDFIDEKTVDYLRCMFGNKLADDLIMSWQNWQNDTYETTNYTLQIDDNTERGGWITIDIPNVDITFDTFRLLNGNGDNIEVRSERFSDQLTLTWEVENSSLKLRILDGKSQIFLSSGELTQSYNLERSFKTETPEERFRIIFNVLLRYKGKKKVSPIANYVWFYLNRDASNYTTTTGEADLNFSRAGTAYETDKFIKATSMRNKMIQAWNVMCELNREVILTLHRHAGSFYPDYCIPLHEHKNLTKTLNTFNL